MIDGRRLQIADNETDFSRRVSELLRDPQWGQTLAAAARGLAVEKYSWERLISDLEPKLEELADRQRHAADSERRDALRYAPRNRE